MADDDDDWYETLKALFDDPAVTAGLTLAGLALLPLAAKLQTGSPEARARFRKRRAADQARREKDLREYEQWSARTRAKAAYMHNGGPGSVLMEQLTKVRVGPADPFPDARYTRLNEPWRVGFLVESEEAGASLRGSWSIREEFGGLRLTLPDGTSWGLPTIGENSGHQWSLDQPSPGQRPRFDLEAAHLAARLLATAQKKPATITLIRPEWPEIYERVWREYLDQHPELGEDYSDVLRRRREARQGKSN